MNETLDHALRLCDLLALDFARLAESEPWIAGLLADCLEHRQQIANRLAFIREKSALTGNAGTVYLEGSK